MGKLKLGRRYTTNHASQRLEKLEFKIQELLFNAGHTINKELVEDIAIIVYQREDRAFNEKDYGKL